MIDNRTEVHKTDRARARRKTMKYATGQRSLGVTEEKLKAAVNNVGNSAEAVEKELRTFLRSLDRAA